MHRAGFGGPLVLASSRWSCTARAGTDARCTASSAPAPRSVEDLAARTVRAALPVCGAALVPEAVPEDAPTDPRNVYAATKLHQEHLCRAFAREHRTCRCTALRYHNVYGPRMPRDTPYAGVARIFRSALERGDAPRVFEDGGAAARLRARVRRGARQRDRARGGRERHLQRGQRISPLGGRHGGDALRRVRPGRSRPGRHGRVSGWATSATWSGRPIDARAALGFEARVGLRVRDGRVRSGDAACGRPAARRTSRRSRCAPRSRSGSGRAPRRRAGTP